MSEVPTRTEGTEQVGAGLQSLVRTLRVLFFLLRITIIIIFVWLLFSGVFFVDEQEEAMLFHFGKLSSRVISRDQGPTKILTSGRWYWAWPYPIDTVKRVPARSSVTVKTEEHFRPLSNRNATDLSKADIQTETLIPECESLPVVPGDFPCWHFRLAPNVCVDTQTQLTINIERGRASLPGFTHMVIRCAASTCKTWPTSS